MTQRVQITVPTYMPVDGQWQIVYPGSVLDVPPALVLSASTTAPVAETPGPTPSARQAASVRNFRAR